VLCTACFENLGGICISDDYGYFESGEEGYAHYMTAVENSQKEINNGGGKGGKDGG
jgi:hypothetical protein